MPLPAEEKEAKYLTANVVTLTKNFRGQLAQDADELTW